jgi:hypothetical protein
LRACLDELGATHPKYVLNLTGHSHHYERTFPRNGVVHIVAGHGGSNLQTDRSGNCVWRGGCPPPTWSAYRAIHHGYLRLHFGATEIRGKAICGPLSGDENEDITCSLGSTMDDFIITANQAVGVADSRSPAGFALAPGFPNPFDRQTTVRFTLPRELPVFVGVFDLSGTRVATLVDGLRPAGPHAIIWNGQTATGARVRSGVYFVLLKTGGVQIARKLVLAR